MAKNKIFGEVGKTKVVDPSTVRDRGYKLLLFADNPVHMRVYKHISRDKDLSRYFVGAWHIDRNDDNSEIVKGQGKKHCHILLDFPNARYWSAVCKSVGFVTDNGVPDTQFCRPITKKVDDTKKGTFEGGCVYLVHANKVGFEPLPFSALFGDSGKVEKAKKAIIAYQAKHVTLSQSLDAIRVWINSQYGKKITSNAFVQWVTASPYVRAAQNPWVREMIWQHNNAISNAYSDFQMEQYKKGYERLSEILSHYIGDYIPAEELPDESSEGVMF